MGGGISSSNQSTQSSVKSDQTTYHSQKSLFETLHETFQNKLVCFEMTEDLQRYEDAKSSSIESVRALVRKYKPKAKKEGISSTGHFKDLLLQVLGERMISKYLEMPRYDIFKVINQEYAKLGFGNDTIKQWKNTVELFQKEFEINMKTIVYSFEGELKDMNKEQILGMNSDLKFHKEHQPSIMSVIITQKFLENKDIALDLANVIETSPTLQVIFLLLYPIDSNGNLLDSFGFDASEYQTIFWLVQAVAKNRKIKAFFFHSIKEYKIVIAPEIYNLIINKLQSETLVAFHLGGFTFSRDFLKKLLFQIISTRSMRFLSLHSERIPKILINIIFPSIEKNSSLTALALTGFDCQSNIAAINDFKEKLNKRLKPLDVVYTGESSIITYPLSIPK